MSGVSLEFEHFTGVNTIPDGAIFHPNGQNYVFCNGASVIIGDLIDPHAQNFLRAHDDFITCVAVSSSGKYIASGQRGTNSDVYIWDFETKSVIYRLEEHDCMIQGLCFSEDEKVFASIGNSEDGKLIVWDMSNGTIIAAANKIALDTWCVQFGGFVKDIKRRNTDHYLICTAGRDGVVMWDLDPYTGDLLPEKITGDARATIVRQVTTVSFSEDKEFLFGATTSGDYIICSLKAHRIVQAVKATRMSLNAIIALNNSVVIGCGDCSIKVYTLAGELRGELALDGPVIGLSASPDKLEVLAATAAGTVARVNITTLKYIIISESHTNAVLKLAFDRGQQAERFATASADGTIKVWDLVEYNVISTCRARKEQERGTIPLCLDFTDIVISGWSDGKICASSAETGESLWCLDNAHPGGVTALTLSHNRRFFLSGGPQGEVRLWEMRSRQMISHLKEHKQKVTSLILFNDDTVAVSSCRDRCCLRWDLKSEMRVHCHMQRMGGINDITLSADQRCLITVGQDKRVVIWDNGKENPLAQIFIDGEKDEGMAIALSHSGELIATGGSEGKLQIWRYYSSSQNGGGQPTMTLEAVSHGTGHSRAINSVAFSRDDKEVVTVGEDGGIFIWCLYLP